MQVFSRLKYRIYINDLWIFTINTIASVYIQDNSKYRNLCHRTFRVIKVFNFYVFFFNLYTYMLIYVYCILYLYIEYSFISIINIKYTSKLVYRFFQTFSIDVTLSIRFRKFLSSSPLYDFYTRYSWYLFVALFLNLISKPQKFCFFFTYNNLNFSF